ncbi:hypothetical protein J3454_14430 [Erythrobacter sp. NFXS35]
MVYLMRHNGKRIAVCLSTFGKWAAGVTATLFTAGFLATFGLIWSSAENSREALSEIRQVNSTLTKYQSDTDKRLDRYEARLRRVEEQDKDGRQ